MATSEIHLWKPRLGMPKARPFGNLVRGACRAFDLTGHLSGSDIEILLATPIDTAIYTDWRKVGDTLHVVIVREGQAGIDESSQETKKTSI
jgi:hypothetical protein